MLRFFQWYYCWCCTHSIQFISNRKKKIILIIRKNLSVHVYQFNSCKLNISFRFCAQFTVRIKILSFWSQYKQKPRVHFYSGWSVFCLFACVSETTWNALFSWHFSIEWWHTTINPCWKSIYSVCAHCVRNDCLLPDNKLLARQKVYNESASKLWILRGKNKTNNGTHGTIWPFCDKVNTTVGCAVNTEHGFKQELTAFSHRSKLSKNREKKKKFSFIYSSSEPLQRKSAKQNQAVTWGEKKNQEQEWQKSLVYECEKFHFTLEPFSLDYLPFYFGILSSK